MFLHSVIRHTLLCNNILRTTNNIRNDFPFLKTTNSGPQPEVTKDGSQPLKPNPQLLHEEYKTIIDDEIEEDFLNEATEIPRDPDKTPAMHNRTIRFNLYRKYSFQIAAICKKGVRVPLPACIQEKIKKAFPDDGSLGYVGYKDEGKGM